MKKLIFISIFFLGLMSYSQDTIVWLGNTDRQKIDSISYSNDTLRIKIENDELKKVRIVSGGDLWSDVVDSDILVDTDATYDLGNSTSQFNIAHFERYTTPNISNDAWWIIDGSSGDHFGLDYSATPSTALSPLYTFHNTGTPTNSTDVATKAYVDANSGADNLGNHTATEDLDMGGFALNNATALTASSRVNTEEVRFNPDNTIGSSTDNNTFGFKTGDIMYAQRVNQTIELGLDFNALTADKNLVFTDSDITWGGTSLLGSGSGDLSSTDIDTFTELDAIVSNASLMKLGGSGGSIPTSLDYARFTSGNTVEGLSSSELLADIVSQGAVNTSSAQTLTNKTINADNNTISNIGSAEITNQSITSADIQDEAIGAALIATNAVSTNKIDDMAVTNAKVMDNTILEPKLNITNAPTDNHILSYNAAGTNFTWIPPSFEVADIGAADKTLTSSDVHKFNYTDDTVIFTLDNNLSVGDELTFAVTDIDSIITVIPDTGVSIIGNGTGPIDGAFQIDSLNIGKVKKLASNLYYAMGYIKPYTTTLLVPSLDNANTVAYIDAREFSGSTNGASVSPTDQSGNGTTFTSTDITKQTDADSDPTFSFNGTSSRISLGNNFNFTAGVAQSIGIFISADGFGTGTRFAKRDDATGGSNDHFAIYNGYYYMGNNEGNPSFSSTTNVLITLTKTTGDVWYIYENGTQRATGAWTNETSAADLLIGAQVNGGGFSDYSTGEIEVFFITDDFITNTEAGTIATEINTR